MPRSQGQVHAWRVLEAQLHLSWSEAWKQQNKVLGVKGSELEVSKEAGVSVGREDCKEVDDLIYILKRLFWLWKLDCKRWGKIGNYCSSPYKI